LKLEDVATLVINVSFTWATERKLGSVAQTVKKKNEFSMIILKVLQIGQ
jgi:hypothetical protein